MLPHTVLDEYLTHWRAGCVYFISVMRAQYISVIQLKAGIFLPASEGCTHRYYSWDLHMGDDYGASSRDNDTGYLLAYLSGCYDDWLGSMEPFVII